MGPPVSVGLTSNLLLMKIPRVRGHTVYVFATQIGEVMEGIVRV